MNVNDYSPLALAFIGDAHYNMIVKRHVIDHEVKMDRMQKLATKYVSAKAQASFYRSLHEEGFFSEEEEAVFRRGRNGNAGSVPHSTDVVTYRISTGFEAILGALYLEKNEKRIREIWQKVRSLKGE